MNQMNWSFRIEETGAGEWVLVEECSHHGRGKVLIYVGLGGGRVVACCEECVRNMVQALAVLAAGSDAVREQLVREASDENGLQSGVGVSEGNSKLGTAE